MRNIGPAGLLALPLFLLLGSAFAAGIVAIYLLKYKTSNFSSTENAERDFRNILLVTLGSTVAIYLGSAAGRVIADMAWSVGITTNSFTSLFYHAVVFFVELFLSLTLARQLLVSGWLSGRWAKLAFPTAAFLIFSASKIVYWNFDYFLQDPLTAISSGIADMYFAILAPFELALEIARTGNFLIPFENALALMKENGGNQFVFVDHFPSFYALAAILTGAAILVAAQRVTDGFQNE